MTKIHWIQPYCKYNTGYFTVQVGSKISRLVHMGLMTLEVPSMR